MFSLAFVFELEFVFWCLCLCGVLVLSWGVVNVFESV